MTGHSAPPVRVGTAGWSIPRAQAERFADAASALERYAQRFDAVEINSSFYRPHRRATYERWAAAVPPTSRFAVKLPKAVTHEQRLVNCDALVTRFADEVGGLGTRRGPLLVQLPPSLAFDRGVAETFFALVAHRMAGDIVCEPRHASWFDPAAGALLEQFGVARVAADPPPLDAAAIPGGRSDLRYYRLHGSPRRYWSAYDSGRLSGWAQDAVTARAHGDAVWIIFDNTASGAAMNDAFAMIAAIASADH